jgi:hypothetical protein
MDWNVAVGAHLSGRKKLSKRGAYGKTASVCPSIIIDGLAPSVASHSSVTNEPHTSTVFLGEHCMSTTPTCEASVRFVKAYETDICCSAMRRMEMRFRMAPSRKLLISDRDM